VEISQQRLDEVNDRLKPLVRRIADASVPFCQLGEQRPINPIGSGVALRIGDRRYLLSASHVFEYAAADRAITVICGDQFVAVRRALVRRTVSRLPIPDVADLAVVILDSAPDETQGFRYISLDEIDPLAGDVEIAPTTSFLALGYPVSKQPRILKDGSYAAFAYHFLTHLEKPDAEPQSLESGQHIAVGYNPRDFVGDPRVSEMPDPVGMSGGGLWRVPHGLTSPNPDGRLTGILIENRKAKKIIIASRIAETLRFLRTLDPANASEIDERFPSLRVPAT
jgi:hypothetical protein